MKKNLWGGYRRKRRFSRAVALVLSATLLVGGNSMAYSTTVYAETLGTVSQGDAASISAVSTTEDVALASVSQNQAMSLLSLGGEGDYTQFTEDELIATYAFGEDVTVDSVYSEDTGYGFSDVEYNEEAKGWSNNVYYPREVSNEEPGATYVTAGSDYLTIASKVWTETESTGYGVYTYENTSSFDMDLVNADYEVEVTLVNPTDSAYTAYLEAENITKATDIEVAAGAEVTTSYTAVLVDGTLNLKFLVKSSATTIDEAQLQNAYVSKVEVTRLATEEAGEKPTIFLASDSTVQTYESNYYPQTGWGETLALFFGGEVVESECEDCDFSQSQTYEAENVIVENRAIGGRSSKSYVEEGKLDDLLEDIKPGDYLFVQWGHNDSTYSRPNRYVSSEDFGQWIQYYVDGALQRGATPVLVTPVARYSYTTNEDGSLNTFVGNFEQYGNVMRTMAEEQDIPLVDLTARSVAVCNNFGIEGAKSLFLWVAAGEYTGAYAGGASDSTHLQYYGAYKFAQCVAQGILESDDALLADLKTKVVINVPDNVPGQISNLESTTVGASSVSMKWDVEADAELYYIYRQQLTDGATIDSVDFSEATKYSVSSINKYTDSNCEAGSTYVYAIGGFNEKGLGEFSNKIEVTTKSAGYKFDFNYNNSPTMEGWIGINQNQMYDATVGYGWITAPNNGRDRDNNGNDDASDMADDFNLGAGEFAIDLPNGDYEVTVYACDLLPGTSTIKPSYTAEGVAFGGISCKQALGSCTGTVRVTDGQLNLTVGGTNQYINGMTITELLKAPSGFGYSEMSIDENTGVATFLIGFNPVDEAVSYNVYAKNSSDTSFSKIKSFTVEQYTADDLSCRAMTGDVGEVYNYYMTCVTSDGTESAPSNTIEVSMIVEGPKAAAPTNLVCTSPTEDDTELQKSISLAWDAVDGAFKYIIYRSEKAEDAKGFSGFEKVGESKTVTFTDEKDVATNIHYYYKVAAMTKTGIGELSDVCKTPITGSLVAGGRESYSDRAVVAINLAGADGGEVNVTATDSQGNELTSGVYVSWRSFEADLDANNNLTTTFTVYRNDAVIASDLKVTNLVDPAGTTSDVYKVVGSNDGALGLSTIATNVWANKYLELSLYCPEDATMPDGSTCDYHANDMSVGDLDGDGQLELVVKWYPSNAKDNSGYGYTGKTFIDGYDVNFATGAVELLWRIDMGVNIRSGAHYTQFQVWDFDGDGKAEIAVKTADGTTTYKSEDGTLSGLVETGYVGACDSDSLPVNVVSDSNDYRNSNGFILDGPEYFSIFNGEDGTKAAEDVEYLPGRGSVSAWGDAYGNRVDRFLSGVAYLDGETPFAVFARGYYTRTCLTAYYMKDSDSDGVGDAIGTYWEFDTDVAGTQYEAQGNHGLGVNDIDNDGKDEIIYGALTIDHDGTVMYSTGLGHGDAMHISDWVSWNNGLEIMSVHEHDDAAYHVEMRDAETGVILMGYYTGKDTGRGVAADIDPTAEGAEWWSIASPTYESNDEPAWDSTNGEVYSTWSTMENLIKLADSTPASNASIFWDGDLLSEIQDHTFNSDAYAPTGVKIYKWNYEKEKQEDLLSSTEIWSNNGTKGNLGLVADILGDWREEIITRTSSNKNTVRIYSTTIETDYVVPCLLEDLAYREAVAWQNIGYNQPANPTYLVSQGLVTAQLSEGEVSSTSAQITFTPANDGDLYGKEITQYEIYRAEGDGEYVKIDTVSVSELGSVTGGGSSDDAKDDTPAIIGWTEGDVVGQYDFGNRSTAEGFTTIAAESYSADAGYGFTSTGDVTYNRVGVSVTLAGDAATALETACGDLSRAGDGMTFAVDVPAGTYRVDAYAGAAYSNSAYNSSKVIINGTDLGVVSQGTTVSDMKKTTDVTLTEDGQIIVIADPNGGSFGILNALVITKLNPVYETTTDDSSDTDEPQTVIKWENVVTEDFEDGASSFALISDSNTAYEYLETDVSTTNNNTSSYVYGVGARSGDTGTQWSGLAVEENVTVTFDVKMDACVQNKSSNFALLGESNKLNWLDSTAQILTICGTASGNGYWGTITVNGVDITSTANVANGASNGESSGKGGLLRDTTGWMKVVAALDFEKQEVALTMTRISDGSTIYTGTVPFVNEVTKLDAIYMAAAKTYGGVFVDNISIDKAVEVPVASDDATTNSNLYAYTDKTVAGNRTYSYKVAAKVNDKTSHMSRAITINTAIAIAEVKDFTLDNIVAGTPLADGATVASLLPATLKVVDTDGNEQDATVTWDVSAVNLNEAGDYKVYATIKGYGAKVEATLKVVANEVKGIQDVADVIMIVGTEAELPEKVTLEYTNTTTEEVSVTWNTESLDTNTIGEYELNGSVESHDDLTAKVVVKVKANYVVSIADVYAEVDINTEDVAAALPQKVSAVFADDTTADVAVTWVAEEVDTATIATVDVKGIVEDFADGVTAHVSIVYPLVGKYDFGISEAEEAEGWTGVTVNAKGGTKTMEELDVHYTEEKGYGFLDASATIDGRSENYTFAGILPDKVYRDFALPAGNTFVVDVPNGTYQVEVVSGSVYKSDVKSNVEGTACNPANTAESYTIGSVTVKVEDGQLTVEFPTGRTSRVDAVIVRAVDVEVDDTPSDDTPSEDTPSGDTPSGDVPSEDAPSGDAPSDDTPSGDTPSEDIPSDDTSNDNTEQDDTSFDTVIESVKDVLNKITSGASKEEIREAVVDVIDAILNVITGKLTDTQIEKLADTEEKILKAMPELVEVEAPEGFEVENAVFNAKEGKKVKVKVQEEKETAINLPKDKRLMNATIYDVNMFVDGKKVQPNVPLELSFERPKSLMVVNMVVLHVVDEQGNYEQLDYRLEDDKIVVITDGLSPFILANMISTPVVNEDNADDNDNDQAVALEPSVTVASVPTTSQSATAVKPAKESALPSVSDATEKNSSNVEKQQGESNKVEDTPVSKETPATISGTTEKVEEVVTATATSVAQGEFPIGWIVLLVVVCAAGFVGFRMLNKRKEEK